MRSETEKMLAGELYDPLDAELVEARNRARDLCQNLNATREDGQEARRRILVDLFGKGGESVWMQPPFFCDYGSNIFLGERVSSTSTAWSSTCAWWRLATSPCSALVANVTTNPVVEAVDESLEDSFLSQAR